MIIKIYRCTDIPMYQCTDDSAISIGKSVNRYIGTFNFTVYIVFFIYLLLSAFLHLLLEGDLDKLSRAGDGD